MHQALCSNGEENAKNYSWLKPVLVLQYVPLVLKNLKRCCMFMLCVLFFIWGLLTKRATGLIDKEPAIIIYSQFILKQGCWSETCLPLKSERRHWYYDLTNDPGSEPLCSQEKKAQHRSFCCLLSRDRLLYLFNVFSETSWIQIHNPGNEITFSSVGRILTYGRTR